MMATFRVDQTYLAPDGAPVTEGYVDFVPQGAASGVVSRQRVYLVEGAFSVDLVRCPLGYVVYENVYGTPEVRVVVPDGPGPVSLDSLRGEWQE